MLAARRSCRPTVALTARSPGRCPSSSAPRRSAFRPVRRSWYSPSVVLFAVSPVRRRFSRPARQPTILLASQPSCSPGSRPTRQAAALLARQPSCSPGSRPARQVAVLLARQPSCSPGSRPAR
ncbi:hypothetical protein BJ912DRAFT_293679 [Pholiota molesta]|nr:hypothetical protein BJ912DRAFT_293679 [Pholiota molesta]